MMSYLYFILAHCDETSLIRLQGMLRECSVCVRLAECDMCHSRVPWPTLVTVVTHYECQTCISGVVA